MLRNYHNTDAAALLSLWNSAGRDMGYAPLSPAAFDKLFLHHPQFSPEYTLIWEETGTIGGFINGCIAENTPHGAERGYLTCLLLAPPYDTQEHTEHLLSALEERFRAAGRTQSIVSFFNPIRLPWVIPHTNGHQHNNAPGVPTDCLLHNRMCGFGYRETARECAMYRTLADFQVPQHIEEQAQRMANAGYTVARYDPHHHVGLEEMVERLGNPMWSSEIPQAGRSGMELLVGLYGNLCAGFTGPIYPEETGRGYFAGLGVAPQQEHHGLGKLLFYRLLEREKAAGAQYMSLFTGADNPAGQIYLDAGFHVVRTFSILQKNLFE